MSVSTGSDDSQDYPMLEITSAIQQKLRIDFEELTKQIQHHGAKGREREALVAEQFLDTYLPATVRVIRGAEIIDWRGGRSRECDLLVVDSSTPRLAGVTFRIVPVEYVHGVVEIKSHLNASELRDAIAKIAQAKALKKEAFQSGANMYQTLSVYGKTFAYFPTYGIIFEYSGGNLSHLLDAQLDAQRRLPMEQWTDLLVVLDSGVIIYTDPTSFHWSVRAMPCSELVAVRSEDALVPATIFAQLAFSTAWLPRVAMDKYFPGPWGISVARKPT
jgi:hypothetical protein